MHFFPSWGGMPEGQERGITCMTQNSRESARFGTSQLCRDTVQANHRKEFAMTADAKSPLEQVNDTLAQAQGNAPLLEDLRRTAHRAVAVVRRAAEKLKQAGKFEDLMTRQAEFHEALDQEISELEELAASLQPPPEEEAAG